MLNQYQYFDRSVFNINHTAYHVASRLNTKTYTVHPYSLKLMTCINIRHTILSFYTID